MEEYFSEQQKEAIAYFKANLDVWLDNPLYKGKYAVIYGSQLVGIFDHFGTAFTEAESKYQRGSYIIQRLISPKDIVSFYYPAIA